MRRFIRMEELSEYTTVSKGDVLDAIENKKMTYCIPVDWKNLGAIVDKEGREYVHAVFDYSGMIILGYQDSREMAIHAKPIDLSRVGIIEPEKVLNWRSVPRVFHGVKSGEVPFVVEPESIPNHYFKAYASVEAGITSKQVQHGFAQLVNMIAEQSTTMPQYDTGRYLKSAAVTINPDIVRIDLKQVAALFPNCMPVQKASMQTHFNSLAISEVTHPIEQIVERVLLQNSDLRADKIWNLLRREVNQNESRIYDIDSVIDEMTSDTMTWFGRGVDSEKSMSYDSFRKGLVARVRAALKTKIN